MAMSTILMLVVIPAVYIPQGRSAFASMSVLTRPNPTDAEWRVADANVLGRAPLLADFLKANTKNVAVITDFCCMECYKRDALHTLQWSLSIVSQYPDQIVVLKGAQEVARLTTQPGIRRNALVDWDQTRGFAEFCDRAASTSSGHQALAPRR
jgi:hypothetical protein